MSAEKGERDCVERGNMKGKEGERQEVQPYQCLRGDPKSFKNIQATYTHTHTNAGSETAFGIQERKPCNRQNSVLKGIVHSTMKMIIIIIIYACCSIPVGCYFFIGTQKENLEDSSSSLYLNTMTNPLQKTITIAIK